MSQRRVWAATGGALSLGGFAAFLGTCCVAPWAVTLLGVSGAVLLARLAFLQPYLLLAAVIALGVAFWWVYRLPQSGPQACDPAVNRRARRWVWTAAIVLAALAAVSLAPMLYSFA